MVVKVQSDVQRKPPPQHPKPVSIQLFLLIKHNGTKTSDTKMRYNIKEFEIVGT